jgi:hypothetical protein
MNMTINEYLDKNNIPSHQSGDDLLTQCPFCENKTGAGEALATFYINQSTGQGTCYACKATKDFQEIAAAFELDDAIENISSGVISFVSKKKRKNDEPEIPIVEQELVPDIPIDTSQFKPLSSAEVLDILGITIKKDEENKLITFLCELSAYTESDQLNISFNAPSSTGKSYIPTEIAQLFPEEDVIELGYCSPTAFFHDRSKEYKKETNELVVDLSRKILIFLDQPHTLLLQHLRPLLSHDKKEIRLKITDKSQKGGLRTKTIFLRGYPAVIFCTAGLRADEQETTRFILLSPQTDTEKIRAAIYEKILKETNREAYASALDNDPKRKLLKERIRAIKQEHITDIRIGSPKKLENAFFGKNKGLKPRHQRDIGRIISLTKGFALLNVWFRERNGSSLVANDDDIIEAFKVWDAISESQELNIPPYVHEIFKDVILPVWIEKNQGGEIPSLGDVSDAGLTRREIAAKHLQVKGRVLADWFLRTQILPLLENAGLIYQEPDPADKRKMLVYPTTASTISPPQNNSGTSGGVTEI